MWSVLFLILSYLDGDFAKAELSALDTEKESSVPYFLLNVTSCAGTSACPVGLSSLKAADANAKSVGQETGNKLHPASNIHTLRRSKRGFTYPGTLWCGAGNNADNYDQLGEFAETDKCCRTHDHCPHVIHAFSSKYGFTNFKWHSISHCDCDNAMKECLREVNDTSSRVVGQAFFNVIEVPCFEFSLEEQCVERHWYGLCKRYDNVPVAVIRESVAYDFGGIEVIDVLTIAPPRIKLSEIGKNGKNEGKNEEMDRSESTTQSSGSESKNPAPEEPSLTNVVTAAEDFIKVLATVSTSQSSSTDGGNTGDTRASDKKRKKNVGKKKKDSKKRQGNGKGKRRKQITDMVSKANGGVTGAPSDSRAEDVINKNIYVEDSGSFDWANKNDNFMNSQFGSVRNIEHSNKMMRDDNQRTLGESPAGSMTAPDAKQEAKMQEPQKQNKEMEFVQLFSTETSTSNATTAIQRQRVAKKRQRHPTSTFLPVKGTLHNVIADNTKGSTTESTRLAGLTTHTNISLPGEEAPHNVASQHEKGSAFNATTQNTPIVVTKKLRLRQKGGRRKSRKPYSPSSPTVSLNAEDPKVLPTDASQELPADVFHDQASRSKGPKDATEKLPALVSGEIRLKTLKGTRTRKRDRRPKPMSSVVEDAIKTEHETIAIMVTNTSTGSAFTDLAVQVQDSERSTGQLLSSTLQTITPSLKPRPSKRTRSKEREDKSKRKDKGHKNLGLNT